MRAVALTDLDSGLRIIDLPVPEPAADELLLRVRTSSINPIDVYMATGTYQGMEYEFPFVPGWDYAGTVARVGAGVVDFAVGDEVFGYWSKSRVRDGAWAEYLAVPVTGAVARKPAALGFEAAAALPLAGITALLAVDAVAPRAGEVALVTGAGGAVGGYAVQLAAAAGAQVIATAKPADDDRLRALGAVETIDYTQQDVAAAVRERHPDGIPVLIDLVNDRAALSELALLVQEGGRVASARWAASRRELGPRGITATNVAADRCGPEELARLVRLVEAGQLSIMLDDVRPFEQLPAAVEEFARGGRGKIVVTVSGDDSA